ncbi:hypothetical protein CHH92_02480 [Bacillus sonorensis]|uniref:Uncharacterized protein n=1 Tax=Bacillus sonorensis L12 TaxID=1274524 RepID=M5P5H6_9BACI|nr:hypothetical protein BSONL12_12891 [Bacillus sonorensis L12]MBG9916777.1 hypothetical protein [Bacillus sonorensis]PAD61324.1 hypothetical protein CHH92_02480 [Bacillus sonorensis]RHJ13504.1 hypothetical protein DW143_02550 [Bacillus sonorensis]GIN66094.1 hypothetical protein J41TS2_15150 [Bacillus sonorensis]
MNERPTLFCKSFNADPHCEFLEKSKMAKAIYVLKLFAEAVVPYVYVKIAGLSDALEETSNLHLVLLQFRRS